MELFLVVLEMEVEGETEFDEMTLSTPIVFPALDLETARVIGDRVARHLAEIHGVDLAVKNVVKVSDSEMDGEPLTYEPFGPWRSVMDFKKLERRVDELEDDWD